jgi:hypothetical protein
MCGAPDSRRDFPSAQGLLAALMLGGMSLARAQEKPIEKVGFILPERDRIVEARSLI